MIACAKYYIFITGVVLIKKKKKDKIAEATFLLTLKKGFGNVSIKEIQEASGLSRGSIYHHFNNKEEIFSYMVNVYLSDNFYEFKKSIKKSSDSFIKRIENCFHLFHDLNEKEFNFPHNFMFSYNYKEYFQIFFSTVYKPTKCKIILHKLYEESFKFYRELVEEAVENKEINDEIRINKY
jgi:AcrR family transcriptional regulator